MRVLFTRRNTIHYQLVLNKQFLLCPVTSWNVTIFPYTPLLSKLFSRISSTLFSAQRTIHPICPTLMCFFLATHCLLCSTFSDASLSTCPKYKENTGQCLLEGTFNGFPKPPHNVEPMNANKPLPIHRTIFELVICGRCAEDVVLGTRRLTDRAQEMLGQRIVRA